MATCRPTADRWELRRTRFCMCVWSLRVPLDMPRCLFFRLYYVCLAERIFHLEAFPGCPVLFLYYVYTIAQPERRTQRSAGRGDYVLNMIVCVVNQLQGTSPQHIGQTMKSLRFEGGWAAMSNHSSYEIILYGEILVGFQGAAC